MASVGKLVELGLSGKYADIWRCMADSQMLPLQCTNPGNAVCPDMQHPFL